MKGFGNGECAIERDGLCPGLSQEDAELLMRHFGTENVELNVPKVGIVKSLVVSDSPRVLVVEFAGMGTGALVDATTATPHVRLWKNGMVELGGGGVSPVPLLREVADFLQAKSASSDEELVRQYMAGTRVATERYHEITGGFAGEV
ncbi:MAG: hypothetical protein WC873_02950 [Candidatus Gracilibacteria bacterium]